MILDIHGLVIECEAESPDVALEVTRPFKYFHSDGLHPAVTIVVKEENPPYNTFPSIEASFSTPRNIVYKDTDRKIIDYFGKGVVVQFTGQDRYYIYGRERNFLVEAFYLLVLSLLGQFCDKKGLLRVHALALSYHDKAILLMLPQGGGKSTMALAMMQEEGFRYISDDDPLVDRSGNILPFPRPLGILDKNTIKSIPDDYVYKVDRMEFGTKYFVDCDYWKGKIETRPLRDTILLTGHRMLNGKPSIEEASKRKVFAVLIRDAVIGIGLYQGLEFILNNSTWEVLGKLHIVFRRSIRALKLTFASETYRFTLSGDIAQNSHVLKEFIKKLP